MSNIQYPENGKKTVNLKSTDLCGNTTREARIVNIIQKLEEGRYIVIDETGDTATISCDPSSDYYNKQQINELIGDLDTVKFKVVNILPAVGAENVIYLVAKTAPDVGYNQYIWDGEDMQFYPIGDTDIDLSEYYTKAQVYTKTEVDTKLDEKQDKLSEGTAISPSDTATLSDCDLGTKKVSKLSLLSLWNWIKDKMTGAISTCVTDDFTGNRALVSTPLGKISYSNVTHEELDKLRNIRSNVQEQIDDKQDELTSASEITTLTDSTEVSKVNLSGKTVAQTKALTIWNYIKSKITNGTLTSVSDTTKLGSIDTSKTNIVQETTAKDLYDYMWKKMYPVGAIYITTSATSPATTFGGTWTKVDDGYFLRASSSGAGGTLDEELPNVKGQTALELANNQGQNGALKITRQSGNRSPNWTGDNSWGTLYLDASKMTNSVYKDNGKVQPKSYKLYVWKRTA